MLSQYSQSFHSSFILLLSLSLTLTLRRLYEWQKVCLSTKILKALFPSFPFDNDNLPPPREVIKETPVLQFAK